jgi:hypothetical protein
MRLHLDSNPRQWRRFTLTSLGGPTALVLILGWRNVLPWPAALAGLALLSTIAVAALARPAWFGGFYRVGMIVGFRLAQGLALVLLSLVFFAVVVPLGLVLRLFGHDPLRLRRRRATATYWEEAPPPGPLERMF